LRPATPRSSPGKEVGDCTADKLFRQVDRDVENIYWTSFSWFLDRNYQILKVHYESVVMKVHLLPAGGTERGGRGFPGGGRHRNHAGLPGDTHVVIPTSGRRKSNLSRMWRKWRGSPGQWGLTTSTPSGSPTRHGCAGIGAVSGVYLHIGNIRRSNELEDVFELSNAVLRRRPNGRPASSWSSR